MQKIVEREFGGFSDLEVIEIGGGVGKYALLFAQQGANVTILDYSEKALSQSRIFFEKHNAKAAFIYQDALNIPVELMNKYNISMSFGLTEHFTGEDRIIINRSHFDVLKKGGITFISVPNKYNLPYRTYKFLSEITGHWKVGEEYPYSRRELKNVCKKIGINDYWFIGDSLWTSFRFINPFTIVKKLLKKYSKPVNSKIKKEKGTFLDQYISYALVLCGRK